MTHLQKALNYYRSTVEKKRPNYVPARVRLLFRVTGDFPFTSTFADAGEHDCQSNQWGAITVLATNGKRLGVKPDEFEVLKWKPSA